MSIVVALLLAVSTGSLALAATASPLHVQSVTQAAATGGCAERWGGPYNDFRMGVCISNRNIQNMVYPDVYVELTPPSSIELGLCTLHIEVWDGGTPLAQYGPYHCTQGHYSASYTSFTTGCRSLHSSVWVRYGGIFYRIGDSPTYRYCF